jgi:hypothetical protein
MSKTRVLLTALSTVIALVGGAACSCQGNTGNGLRTQSSGIILTAERTNITMAPDRREKIVVVATLGTNGTPVGGLRCDAAMTANNGGARITSGDSLTTDDDGRVEFEVQAGSTAAQFQFRVTTEQAEPAIVDIKVDGRFGGNIVVRSGYSGQLKIARLEVRLHDGRGACDPRWGQLNDLPRGLPQAILTMTPPNTSTDARFNKLTENTKYIATVVAKNALDRPIAYGCAGPATVVAGRDTFISVRLETLPPTVQGKYRFGQQIDILGFMDSDSNTYRTLRTLSNILISPVRGLANGIVTKSNEKNGGCALANLNDTLCNAAVGLLDAGFQLAISAAGGVTSDIFSALSNSAEMLTRPTFGGYLEIKTFNPTTLEWTGVYTFDSFNFVWDAGLPGCKNSTDPCCSHKIYDGGDINLTVFTAQVKGKLEKQNNGSYSPTYNITMDETALSIAAGKIILALLESVILPSVLPKDFPGAQDKRVTIGEFATGIFNSQCTGDNGAEKAACNALRGTIDQILPLLSNVLTFDGNEQTNITQWLENGVLTDIDDDLQLDDLRGTIKTKATAAGNSTQESGYGIAGRYEGISCSSDIQCNQARPTDSATVQLACRFAQNPVDSCFASNFCGVPEGSRRGGETCIADTECFSGTCMKRPIGSYTYSDAQVDKCFKACKTDFDCAGEGTCDTDGYTFTRQDSTQSVYLPGDFTVTGTCVRTVAKP